MWTNLSKKLFSGFKKFYIGLAIVGLNVGSVTLVSALPGNVINNDTAETFSSIQDAIDDSDTLDGHTLTLLGDQSTSSQISVTKDLTIEGAGYTVSPTFTKTSNSNNSAFTIYSDGVTIQNMNVDGAGGIDLHGINVYVADGVLISNVSSSNFRSGVVVNGSSVTVHNISTSGNAWHGINVDQGGGVTNPAVLTVTGYSAHAETSVAHILVDDITKAVSVVDTMSQYTYTDYGNTRVYTLQDIIAPDAFLVSPADNTYTDGVSVTQTWSSTATDVDYYVYESYNDAAATNLRWTNTYTTTSKTATNIADTVYWWRVKAVDTSGNESPWTPVWKITVDKTAPAKVDGMTIFKGTTTSGTELFCDGYTNERWITVDWNDSADPNFDFYRYQVKSGWSTTLTPSQRTGQISDLDGEYKYHVQAVDKVGNTGDYSDWCYVTLDRVPPVVDITSHTSGDHVAGTVNIAGTVMDLNNHHYWFVVQNSSGTTVAGPGVVNDFTSPINVALAWDSTTVPDGNYTIKLEARDQANNKDATSVEWVTVTVDNTAPLVGISAPVAGDDVTGLLDLAGSVTDNLGLSHYNFSLYPSTTDLSDGQTHSADRLNDANWCTLPTSGTVHLSTDFAGNLCTGWDTTNYPDGDYQLRLAARDGVQNRDTSDPYTALTTSVHVLPFTIDNTAPVANAGSDRGNQTASFVQTGSATDVTSGVASTAWSVVSGPGAVTFGSASSLLTTVSASAVGDYELKLTVTDNAGNTAEDTFTFTWTLPTVAPTVLGATNVVTTTSAIGGGTSTPSSANGGEVAGDSTEEGVEEDAVDESELNTDDFSTIPQTLGESDSEDDCFKIIGLCWYWWILILLVIGGLWWLLGRDTGEKK